MDTVILQCNERDEPGVRSWILEVQGELKEGESLDWTWSCGRVRKIQVGDRIFLQRTGDPPRGYFASGYTMDASQEEQLRLQNPAYQDLSEAYHNSFYNNSFKICFKIDSIVNFDFPLEIDYLESLPQFDGCKFKRQGGGTSFNSDYAQFLEQEWEKHTRKLSRQGLGVRLIDTYCSNAAKRTKDDKYSEAYELYSAALILNPNYPQAKIGLGNSLIYLERFAEAITAYTDALSLKTKFDKIAYFKRAVAYSRIKDYQSAVEDYKKAVEIDPDLFEAHLKLGDVLSRMGQNEAAIESYSEAIRVNPSKATAYVNRGKAFSRLNHLREAEEDWKRALEVDPTLKEVVSKLIDTIGSLDLSEDSLDKNIKKHSHDSEEQETDNQTDESNILSAQETEILNNRFGNISEKERETVTQARRGQGLFRNQVIEYWSTCAVTGCAEHSLLRASHIKPWAKCNLEEALDPFNGLLLSPSLDAAFDTGYISFDNAGKILISEYLSQSDAQILGIFPSLHLSNIHSRHQQYLAYHRQNIFKG